MSVIEVKSKDQFQSLINGDKAAIVDFTATWCGPCQMIKPFYEEQSKNHTTINFLKVDVDELDELSGEAGVSAMPTFQIYKDGVKVDEIVGASKNELISLIQKYA